jgi:hypothetical protein
VVQVYFFSIVKTNRLEGNSSDAYLKKSCSNFRRLGWVNAQRDWVTFLDDSNGSIRDIWMRQWRWLEESM